MNISFVGLGSNIEPREENLNRALQLIEENDDVTIVKRSSIYETEPVDYTEQDKFLNMVIKLETSMKNLELLQFLQEVETTLGRKREEEIEKGPRTIDLDILLFNNENRDLDVLRIPHPRMHERAFVLVPLSEIAPDQVMPTSGRRIDELLEQLPEKEIEKVVLYKKVT
ncbi:MAG TPA: 2-amino-4-hydroxy-6-hydroxymethyldihydropteridine diphosphokinase [Pseudogracilibacillus sp.]|nr:2-amino-4-hydroxy-6-hydroxymethyldihydropteridine diphosphokinase [Pseudogracilibacillus sp.]HZW67598.1 2-amino-4-hydroxy-6-hydroxymethyldihydropteridine diphosphokinase [Pseudogracilibacillus sp.]